jgi:hypothetical protein
VHFRCQPFGIANALAKGERTMTWILDAVLFQSFVLAGVALLLMVRTAK